MEMCYDGTLVMPKQFAVVTEDEMEYVDGGVYVSNRTLWNCCRAAFYSVAFNPIGSTLVAIGAWKAYTLLAAGVTKIALKLGAISKVLGIALGIIGFGVIKDCGYNIIDALIQGKGIDFGIKKTRWGIPYGIKADVC